MHLLTVLSCKTQCNSPKALSHSHLWLSRWVGLPISGLTGLQMQSQSRPSNSLTTSPEATRTPYRASRHRLTHNGPTCPGNRLQANLHAIHLPVVPVFRCEIISLQVDMLLRDPFIRTFAGGCPCGNPTLHYRQVGPLSSLTHLHVGRWITLFSRMSAGRTTKSRIYHILYARVCKK